MKTINEIVSRAEKESSDGRIWRSKEILQGNVGHYSYAKHTSSSDVLILYRAYADLLMRMGDTVEAGKYYFLSGYRGDESLEAIKAFVSRYTRHNVLNLYHTFPIRAKLEKVSNYPQQVAEDILQLGIPEEVWQACRPSKRIFPKPEHLQKRPKLEKIKDGIGLSIVLTVIFLPWLVGVAACVYGIIWLINH